MPRADLLAKILMPEKIEATRKRGQERMRWHHQLSGHEFEQSPGDGAGHRILACGSPWRHKESGANERLNSNKMNPFVFLCIELI